MAPRFDARLNSSIIAVRRPLGEVNRENKGLLTGQELAQGIKEEHGPNEVNAADPGSVYSAGPPPEKLLRDLQQQLHRLFTAKPSEKMPMMMGAFITMNWNLFIFKI